jgi:dimethylamine monooxygenase subunit A
MSTDAAGPGPSWLDELDLRPGPPWVALGTRGLGVDRPGADLRFVADDQHDAQLAEKARLLAERRDELVAVLPSARTAAAEVLEAVVAVTGRPPEDDLEPLDAAGRMVQEDLCLLVEREGAHHLDGASLCFPSYWSLADKLGRPLAEVHGPVPHYADSLAERVERHLAGLRPGRPVWRRNWSIHDDPTLHLPGPTPPRPVDPPEGLWLRSERQTLSRLPRSGAVLFTIGTQQVPLSVLAGRPDLAAATADAIEAWSEGMRAYKGGHGALAAVAWLRSTARRSTSGRSLGPCCSDDPRP